MQIPMPTGVLSVLPEYLSHFFAPARDSELEGRELKKPQDIQVARTAMQEEAIRDGPDTVPKADKHARMLREQQLLGQVGTAMSFKILRKPTNQASHMLVDVHLTFADYADAAFTEEVGSVEVGRKYTVTMMKQHAEESRSVDVGRECTIVIMMALMFQSISKTRRSAHWLQDHEGQAIPCRSPLAAIISLYKHPTSLQDSGRWENYAYEDATWEPGEIVGVRASTHIGSIESTMMLPPYAYSWGKVMSYSSGHTA